MKTDLDHLPDRKRRDLARIVEILFAEFEDALALSTQKWKKQGRILKVILYGSYARGDWVADPKGGYYSDYDVLVVVSDERLTDPVAARAALARLRAHLVPPGILLLDLFVPSNGAQRNGIRADRTHPPARRRAGRRGARHR